MIQRMYILYSILLQPAHNFRRPHTPGARSLRHIHQIRRMIAMPMCYKNIVCINLINIKVFCKRIARKERIKKYRFPVYLDR